MAVEVKCLESDGVMAVVLGFSLFLKKGVRKKASENSDC